MSGPVKTLLCMPQNFLGCDREQALLLPPSLREWLDEDHLAWLVLDVVGEIDLGEFYAAYRADGHGRAAHDPAMMVALLLYSYALGQRSSRAIERRCREDVPTRVICANQAPDHTTIARFRARHQDALARTFTQVLALCARAGLVSVGVVALDGTAMAANASREATRSYPAIREEVDRISAKPPSSTRPRMLSMAAAAATNCRPSWPTVVRGLRGCAAAAKNSRPSRPRSRPPTR